MQTGRPSLSGGKGKPVQPSVNAMPPYQSSSTGVYASPAYRQGYAAGVKAAHLRRPDTNPYLLQDLRHLGWMDAFYDAWSARRVEISRASERRDVPRIDALAESMAPSAGQNIHRDR
jgi:hypothetical protein